MATHASAAKSPDSNIDLLAAFNVSTRFTTGVNKSVTPTALTMSALLDQTLGIILCEATSAGIPKYNNGN